MVPNNHNPKDTSSHVGVMAQLPTTTTRFRSCRGVDFRFSVDHPSAREHRQQQQQPQQRQRQTSNAANDGSNADFTDANADDNIRAGRIWLENTVSGDQWCVLRIV